MSKIKMVGLDLDGTLLNDRKEVTAYARDVICRALVMRVMVRLLVSVICMRMLAPRLRMRTLGSACAVINGSVRTAN